MGTEEQFFSCSPAGLSTAADRESKLKQTKQIHGVNASISILIDCCTR